MSVSPGIVLLAVDRVGRDDDLGGGDCGCRLLGVDGAGDEQQSTGCVADRLQCCVEPVWLTLFGVLL